MNITLPRLYWKEFRQLAPVLMAIFAIGMFLFVLRVAFGTGSNSAIAVTCDLSLFLMPCMYAIGAAAILISQEKEQRTMQWMQSMPISPSRIISTKAVVSIIGFIAVSLFSWLLILPWINDLKFDVRGGMLVDNSSLQGIAYYGLAIYLLIAASAASWRTSTLVRSIFLLLLLAVLPKAFESIYLWASEILYGSLTRMLGYENAVFALAFVMPIGLVLCALAYRWGLASMRPAVAADSSQKLAKIISSWHPFAGIQWLSRERILAWSSAMIWQTLRQYGWVIFLPTVVLFLTMYLGVWNDLNDLRVPILACAWLGYLGAWTFQGDASHRRFRFLSDRGVSGGQIWSYRISIMILVVIGTTVLAHFASRTWSVFNNATPLHAICFVLVVYALAQWSGQLSYSMVLALIQTPAVIISGVIYLTFAYYQLQAPIGIMIVMCAIPFLVTRLTMQRWVDGRWDLRFWMTHAIGLACWIALPLSAPLYQYSILPHMNANVRSDISEEARKWPYRRTTSPSGDWAYERPRHLGVTGFNGYPESGYQLQSLPETLENHVIQNLQRLNLQINEIKRSDRSLAVDPRTISRIHTLASMTSYFAQHSQDEQTGSKSDWQNHFRSSINIFVEVIPYIRACSSLIQQDNADVMEILLLMHLKAPGNLDLLDKPSLGECRKILIDRDARLSARRRSVAVSWKIYMENKNSNLIFAELGGYLLGPFNEDKGVYGFSDRMINASRAEQIAECLWRIANQRGSSADQEIIELAKLCELPPSGAIAPVRAENLDQYLIQYPENYSLPAVQWNAKWEDIAEEFATESLTNE